MANSRQPPRTIVIKLIRGMLSLLKFVDLNTSSFTTKNTRFLLYHGNLNYERKNSKENSRRTLALRGLVERAQESLPIYFLVLSVRRTRRAAQVLVPVFLMAIFTLVYFSQVWSMAIFSPIRWRICYGGASKSASWETVWAGCWLVVNWRQCTAAGLTKVHTFSQIFFALIIERVTKTRWISVLSRLEENSFQALMKTKYG